ncbi:MAG: hypothetical protein F6K48_31185 [Okeania sp. SIO3H1]|nr:hypothetical protein [Okeania sp. SIO3H1]
MRFTSLLVGVGDRRQPTPRPSPDRGGEDRRQPTPDPSQEGRNRNERGGRSNNCQFGIFLP